MKLTQNVYGGGSTYISTYWEHWDVSTGQVLFETGNAGGTIDLGNIGVSNASNGVTVEDRGPFGEIAATHTGLEFSAWSEAPPTKPLGKLGYYTSGAIGSAYPGTDPQEVGRYLDDQRPDAFIDDTYGVSFQGVRTADANTSVWMEPDPVAGSQEDLLSQQPYIWNGNNGLLNQDPSGFCYQDETICVHPPPTDTGVGGEDLSDILAAIAPGPMAAFSPILPENQVSYVVRCASYPCLISVPKSCLSAVQKQRSDQAKLSEYLKEANGPDPEQMRSTYTDLEPGGAGRAPLLEVVVRLADTAELGIKQAKLIRQANLVEHDKKASIKACPQSGPQ